MFMLLLVAVLEEAATVVGHSVAVAVQAVF
jgi:hypothetical protein